LATSACCQAFPVEASGLNGGFCPHTGAKVFLAEAFPNFLFDGLRLRIQQAAQVSFVGGFEFFGVGRTESCNSAANARAMTSNAAAKASGPRRREEVFPRSDDTAFA